MSANHKFFEFFKVVAGAGKYEPYPYQTRLACGEEVGDIKSCGGCKSMLIDIPTGMGKTAAVVMAWLWNRVIQKNEKWPRRLVYCLPMRTLVEQTRDEVNDWLNAAWQKYPSTELEWLKENSPVILMGGEKAEKDQMEWDLHPEKEAILIGTQDMLLSRALNRGYGMSRFRWPMHFGLLNNDCLWVLDETQLMGVGIETSSQLEGLRREEKLGASICSQTWWMSATLDENQLATVDFPAAELGLGKCELSNDERESEKVRQRLMAEKRIQAHEVVLENDTVGDVKNYAQAMAESIRDLHETDTLTLAVFNRVDRAQKIFAQLQKLKPEAEIALIHSRFRAGDRLEQQRILEKTKNRIVIATQAIEAGVDVSARVLLTELAPWSSLVQRFGRCHRYGEISEGADIFWIDLNSADDKKMKSLALPYEADELKTARQVMRSLTSGNAMALSEITIPAPQIIRPVIRRKDFLDLADTTPDLAGNDLDISRYVRDGDDTDVQLFWRYVDENANEPTADSHKSPQRDELCRVSVHQFRSFIKKAKDTKIWRWDHLEREWQKTDRGVPGQVYLIDAEMGGYSAEFGWTGDKKHIPTIFESAEDSPEGYGGDQLSRLGVLKTLTQHTENVVGEVEAILKNVRFSDSLSASIVTAARWHDVGKAHPVFQEATGAKGTDREGKLWAKAESMKNYRRKFFRHELVSALMWLQAGERTNPVDSRTDPVGSENQRDLIVKRDLNLIAFLIAAHHGKVRFSIRALPGEDEPADGGQLFARGVWDGDRVPGEPVGEIHIGELEIAADELDLGLMRLGAGSWLERMIGLLESTELGPFRLGFLETVLRSADMRASAAEAAEAGEGGEQ